MSQNINQPGQQADTNNAMPWMQSSAPTDGATPASQGQQPSLDQSTQRSHAAPLPAQQPQAYPVSNQMQPGHVQSQQAVQHYQPAMGNPAMLGKVRNNWACIGLFIITLGIYGFFWTYNAYSEMKRHRGAGTSGGVAVLLMFVPFATYFMTPAEVSSLYTSKGRMAPVSGATGLWCFLPFLGPLVWFLQVNGALNDYWKSMGAGVQQGQPQLSA